MKVLHVVTAHSRSNAFGGPMRVALNLATEQQRRGYSASILTLALDAESAVQQIEGVPVTTLPARRVLPRSTGFSGLTSPALLPRMWHLADQADLVHVHLARDLVTLPAALLALSRRVPLVLQPHGMVDPSGRRSAKVLDRLATRRLLRSCSALLYLSATELADLRAVAGDSLPRARALPNGVRAEAAQPRPAGPPLISFVARLHPRKRPLKFVEAIPAILRAQPTARFAIAGPDEGEGARVAAAVVKLDLGSAVELHDGLSHEDTIRLLRDSTVYVLPAVDEPFPMSVLEAMSVGTPVVVTTSNGLAEAVASSGAGVVTGINDAVAPAVLSLLDPDALASASTAARKLIAEQYTIDSVADRLHRIYQEVVSRQLANSR